MSSWDNASFLRRATDVKFKGVKLGSINSIGWNITDDEATWLLTNAEASKMSVAEFLSGLVSDAYFEESDDDKT